MSKKKRISLRVDEDEVAVVGPKDRWEHLISVYEALAEWYPNFEAEYLDHAEWIRNFISRVDTSENLDGDE